MKRRDGAGDVGPADRLEVRAVDIPDGSRVAAQVTAARSSTTFVLSHGLACDHRLWDDYVRPLSRLGTVITWDFPGHGESPVPDDPRAALRPEALAQDLRAMIDAVAPGTTREIVLVGHSLGGLVSLIALRDHAALRARAAAMLLIATPLTDLGQAMWEGRRFADSRAAGLRAGVAWALGNPVTHAAFGHRLNAAYTYGLVRNMGFGRRPDPTSVRHLRQLLAATPAHIRRAALSGTFGVDVRGTLAPIDVPTLVVVGGRDRLVPARHSLALLDELPHSRAVHYPDAAHAVVLEQASGIIADIQEFLEYRVAADTG